MPPRTASTTTNWSVSASCRFLLLLPPAAALGGLCIALLKGQCFLANCTLCHLGSWWLLCYPVVLLLCWYLPVLFIWTLL